MKVIEHVLFNTGKIALFDEEDYKALLLKISPGCRLYQSATGYVRAGFKIDSNVLHIPVHRVILNAKPHEIVDHINMNPLDNRRSNIRIGNKSTNSANRNAYSKLHSKILYKGVSYNGPKTRFVAKINNKYIGTFDTQEEAAKAYDKEAVRIFGEFARTNFPS